MDCKIEVTRWTKYQIYLVCLLLISGSINTIIILWMNNTESIGCYEMYPFVHPFFQADLQYFGQVLCFIVIYATINILMIRDDDSENRNWLTKGTREFKLSAMWPPAMLDLFSLSALYVGITMTNHFSFQSLRGSIIIFTAIFSRCKLIKRQWIAVAIILIGLLTVGLGDVSHESGNESILFYAIKTRNISEIFFNSNFPIFFHCSNSTNNEMEHMMLLGDALIIFSQLIKAFQLIYEEIYIKEFNLVPLMVVGWEGVFNFLLLSSFISVFWMVPGDVMCQRDSKEAFTQMKNNSTLITLAVLLTVSNGVFTFSGISITKEMSAITRAVLEIMLLAVVWFLAVVIGWKKFHWLQVRIEILIEGGFEMKLVS